MTRLNFSQHCHPERSAAKSKDLRLPPSTPAQHCHPERSAAKSKDLRLPPSTPPQHCHPERSAAKSKDLRFCRRYLLALLLFSLPALAQQQPAQTPSPTDPAATARNLNLPTPANPRLPTLWLVGDSTVRNGHGDGAQGQWGWGEPLVAFFNPAKINVVNRAIGGRSSRSYINEGQWALTLAMIKPGDTVLFQWGHNDGGDPADPARARASLPGIGAETKEIENPILHRHETVHTYGFYLRQYLAETRAKGATPILCSLIPRKGFTAGKANRNADNYAGWAHQIADQTHTGFIDLNELIAAQYDVLGPEKVEPLFADPHTHTSLAGAELNAATVVRGLKLLPHDPVAADFSRKGEAIQP